MYEIFELFAEDSLLCKTPCKNKHKRAENLRWNGLVAEMERLVAELEHQEKQVAELPQEERNSLKQRTQAVLPFAWVRFCVDF